MTSKIWLTNLALAVMLVFFGLKTYQVWSEPEKPSKKPKPSQTSPAQPEIRLMPKKIPQPTAYQIVAEKTIFSPDRKEVAKKADGAQAAKAPSKFSLWGVAISDKGRRALIGDSSKSGLAKNRWVSEGDSIDDLKVASVLSDRIILAEGDNRQEILLYDVAKPVRREQIQKDAEPLMIAGTESQGKQMPMAAEKTPANPLIPPPAHPAEKKSEPPQTDKKSAAPQTVQPPAPAKTQHKPSAEGVMNPFMNLLRGSN